MTSERYKTRLGTLMAAVAASLLVACAMEEDTLTPDKSTTTDETSSVTGQEPAIHTIASNMNFATPAATLCAKVDAPSIPLYSTASGFTVNCTFLRGDIFSVLAFAANGRLLNWCPRHTPLDQGILSWAPMAGTEPIACPF